MLEKKLKNIRESYTTFCRKVGAGLMSPTPRQAQVCLFIIGVGLLSAGLLQSAHAIGGAPGATGGTAYNDTRIANAVNAVMTYLEGSFGALIMAASGIGAIVAAAFGNYKAALSLMVVAVGAFILRSVMSTFFNDQNIQT